ncbi:MAG: hypothetical protein FJ288_18955 [Planctomycetes bacterium]|nr:hypothetical protein [Planctomycetota bacterium]
MLDWIGKTAVVDHHREVPYHLPGVHQGKAVCLLFNGVLGDRRPAGGNVLTHDVARNPPAHPAGRGPRVVCGEACRLGPKSLDRYGLTFRQIPFELKVD